MEIKLFLVYTLLFLTLVAGDCPKGFEELPSQDGCVIAVGKDVFYEDVVRYCYGLKAIPAKILNVFDNSYVFALLQTELNSTPPFIGVEKKPNGVWTYADGSPLTYDNWAPNEPRVSNSSICAIMDPESGRWLAAECSYARPFICSVDEKNQDSTTSTQAISTRQPQPPTTHSPLSSCPYGWSYLNTTGYCYYVSAFVYLDGENWGLVHQDQGESFCQSMNSHLVSIHSKEEDDFVGNLVHSEITPGSQNSNMQCSTASAWIGYVGNGDRRNGEWTDGTPVDYTGAPVGYASTYRWSVLNDRSCLDWYTWNPENNVAALARYTCKAMPF